MKVLHVDENHPKLLEMLSKARKNHVTWEFGLICFYIFQKQWRAYKFEVNDAIPYNGAIMHSQGVTVAFNSCSITSRLKSL